MANDIQSLIGELLQHEINDWTPLFDDMRKCIGYIDSSGVNMTIRHGSDKPPHTMIINYNGVQIVVGESYADYFQLSCYYMKLRQLALRETWNIQVI